MFLHFVSFGTPDCPDLFLGIQSAVSFFRSVAVASRGLSVGDATYFMAFDPKPSQRIVKMPDGRGGILDALRWDCQWR